MDPRFVFAALAGAFGVAFIIATVTVVRHVTQWSRLGHSINASSPRPWFFRRPANSTHHEN